MKHVNYIEVPVFRYHKLEVSGVRCQQTDDGMQNLIIPDITGAYS
jgi:hypothetical protein